MFGECFGDPLPRPILYFLVNPFIGDDVKFPFAVQKHDEDAGFVFSVVHPQPSELVQCEIVERKPLIFPPPAMEDRNANFAARVLLGLSNLRRNRAEIFFGEYSSCQG